MSTIWCVEDEQNIRELLIYTLEAVGFRARGFEDGKSFRQALESEKPDLILLDIMLPDEDGISLLNRIRQEKETREIPVIMTTAKSLDIDKISALDKGADDYLCKPFSMMELTARIRAVLRRVKKEPENNNCLVCNGIELDPISHHVLVDGEPVDLTLKEFELLRCFMENPNRAFSRDDLFEKIWHSDFIGESRTVDVHIRSLRSKLKDKASCIETIRGIGYRMKNR